MVIRSTVDFRDKYGLKDKLSLSDDHKSVKGRVKIYEHYVGDKKIYLVRDTTNLVVFRGRRWLVQKAFNTNYSGADDYNSLFIGWLGIGTGGAPSGHPLTPTAPSLSNVGLSSHGVIESGTRYVTVDGKQYHKFDADYPVFEIDDEASIYGTSEADDARIIARIVTTLESDEANDDGGLIDPNAYQEINECGLFIADTNTVSPAPTRMELFSRCTFPTHRKNNEMELIFDWSLYF